MIAEDFEEEVDMPCGGIIICAAPEPNPENQCWVCGKQGCCHFMIEWDAYIHARCAADRLMDKDSDVHLLVVHKHDVQLDFSLEEATENG